MELERRPDVSWLADEHVGFGVHALPYGSFSTGGRRRVGVAVGESVLDLTEAAARLLPQYASLFGGGSLDGLLAAGPTAWRQVRTAVQLWLDDEGVRRVVEPLLVPAHDVRLHLPFAVADYADFYSCEHHAANVGRIFRPDGDPLPVSWKHLPAGYHGRAGTVVVSGTPVVRPNGLRRSHNGVAFGPTERLDVEVEVGFVVGMPSELGRPVPLHRFRDHVFGVCLLNDWSARDVQAFETVPLGPFLAKSFATSVSPWVVPLDALDDARLNAPTQDPPPASYLAGPSYGYDLQLQLRINDSLVASPQFRDMYWTPAQQLAHLTVNGATLRTGDLLGSGTVSGPMRQQRGCLLELTWGGTEPVHLRDGTERVWLQDGDEVVISATAPGPDGTVVPLGNVRGVVAPAVSAF